jgi:hypothetical protein
MATKGHSDPTAVAQKPAVGGSHLDNEDRERVWDAVPACSTLLGSRRVAPTRSATRIEARLPISMSRTTERTVSISRAMSIIAVVAAVASPSTAGARGH